MTLVNLLILGALLLFDQLLKRRLAGQAQADADQRASVATTIT